MLSISTSFITSETGDAETILLETEKFDIKGIELEYRIHANTFARLKPLLQHSHLNVVSIHNFFPIPAEPKGLKGDGDLIPLSHPDKDMRNEAVRLTSKTIETANSLSVERVVLHSGFVDMGEETKTLKALHKNGNPPTFEETHYLEKKKKEIEKNKKPYMDGLKFSLDKLLHKAEKENVSLGLENRYYIHELPGYDDFEELFQEFKGAPLGYWHDAGHAHIQEKMGIMPENGLLSRYEQHLLGMHIHDALGHLDHKPPGQGEINLKRTATYLKDGMPAVIELKSCYTTEEIENGIEYFKELQKE